MDQIENKNFPIVRYLYKTLAIFQPMCAAVLEGDWSGDVWVDNIDNPRASLLLTHLPAGGPAWCFLAGNPESAGFNSAINSFIFSENSVYKDTSAFLFTCDPENWGNRLNIIAEPRQPVPMARQHYRCTEMTFDWRGVLPDGFTIIPMEIDLLKKDDLHLPPVVNATLGKWRSINQPVFRDFGFLIIHDNRVVSWATVDFVSGSSGDLGFETIPEFQKRGLGTAVAGAALEDGLKKGIEVHWTCADYNLGSQKTAQKLGLIHDRDYIMYLFHRDLTEHLAQLAYSYLARGDYRQAILTYEDLFEQDASVPIWAYFDTAQAWAALGEAENALRYLRLAAKEGWSAVEMTKKVPEFQFLRDQQEWVDVIAKMEQNRQDSP